MSRPRMRPRFRVPVEGDVEAARARLRQALATEDCAVRGSRIGQRFELTVPEVDQHYWSPHLSVILEEDDDGRAFAEGRFGPHPHVWTMFMAIYAVVTFLGIAAAVYGVSQWTLGQSPSGFWGIPGAALIGAVVYLSAFYGQGLGSDQMYALRSFVDGALHADAAGPPPDAQG